MRLNVRQFQALHEISMSSLGDIDKAIAYVSTINGMTPSEIEDMDTSKFNKICASIVGAYTSQHKRSMENDKPQRYIKANGQWYEIHYDLSKEPFNAGRYVEVTTFSRDLIRNLNRIMASIVTPVSFNWLTLKFVPLKDTSQYTHERISIDMLEADINIVHHSCLFFYALFIHTIKDSRTYLLKTAEKKEEAEVSVQTLLTTLDGFIQAQWYLKWRDAH